ncbi:MAG: GntR family transcriptional regulator [Anaerolineales bacterium]|nr:MAG: GntR family transcriptional regulator [Anaerolineales bacterium]
MVIPQSSETDLPAPSRLRLDSRPLYVRAEEALAALLENGSYQPGDQLPPEPELAQQLGISRSTLREAMRTFEERGLITRRQGVGTFVNMPSPVLIDSGLETLESVDTLVRRRGMTIQTRDLEIEEKPASYRLARLLEVAEGAPLTVVTRTKVAGGRPVAYMVDALSASVVSVADMRAGFQGSVLDYLLTQDALALAHARADILPVPADVLQSMHLEIEPGTILLLLEETLYSVTGQVISFSRNYFVPEFFKFHVVRRI